jgi:LemA protein
VSAAGPAAKAEAEGAQPGAAAGVRAGGGLPAAARAESFAQLQASLGQIEDAVQNARRYYNAVVRDLNTRVAQFPSNLVASAFGFATREFFELTSEGEREPPRVRFGAETS